MGAFCTGGHAQGVEEIPLRLSLPSSEAPLVEGIAYRQNGFDDRGFNRVVTQVAVPTLTVYRPAQSAHRGAAIVICPGGGYEYVVIDREGHMLARYFQQQGITAVVLKYRLPKPGAGGPALPLPQQDALEAVRLLRSRSGEWGLDARRIGILGCSAGGHLAGSTGVFGDQDTGSRPDFVALLYPVICLEGPHVHEGSRRRLLGPDATLEQWRKYSLERQVRAGMPPYFLAHARDDTAVPHQNSELLAAALSQVGVPVELLLLDSGRHGFALGRDAESGRWKEAFLRWLDRLP